MPIAVPRDRDGSFEPELVKKGQSRALERMYQIVIFDALRVKIRDADSRMVKSEPKNRGVQDVLIAVVDGLKGFPKAITAAFPDATVQTCRKHRQHRRWKRPLHDTVPAPG